MKKRWSRLKCIKMLKVTTNTKIWEWYNTKVTERNYSNNISVFAKKSWMKRQKKGGETVILKGDHEINDFLI